MSADAGVTDRGWTARQPDGTPVGEPPLRSGTIRALRAAGVLTLRELRALDDRELRTLRRFGPVALADVRFLVPAPAPAVSGGDEVTIAGRPFRLGAVYRPRQRAGSGRPYGPRRLLGYSTDSLLPGGRVTVVLVPSGAKRVMPGTVWAAWAGEPVEDGLEDIGR